MTYLFLSSLFWFAFACGRASKKTQRADYIPTAWMLEAKYRQIGREYRQIKGLR